MRPLLLALLLAPAAALAQGTVRYDVTTRLEFDLPPEVEHLRDQLPTRQTTQQLVVFDAAASLEREVADGDGALGTETTQVVVQRPRTVTHVRFADGARTQQIETYGRTFLVEDAPEPRRWRLTGQEAEYLGYPCLHAVSGADSTLVEAWFTPAIPVPAGPAPYGGLPGLILVVSEDGGRREFIAREVTVGPPDEAPAVPTEGRRMSRDAYTAMIEERLEASRDAWGSGATVIKTTR